MLEYKKNAFIPYFFPVFNSLVLLYYIINFDLPKSSYLFYIVILILIFSIFSIFTLKINFFILKILYNLQITLFSIIFLLFLTEILYKITPSAFPLQLKNYLSSKDIEKIRKKTVEYLSENPYAKFKSNTTITSAGWRGTKDQFVYDWRTDDLGFKNLKNISDLKKVDIVTIGNSFTEGMGVETKKTWPSLLNFNGHKTYNLGVQGYSPTQLLGSLEKYGVKLKPKYIIVGYTETTYNREKAFFNIKKLQIEKNYPTDIFRNFKNRNFEIKLQARYVVSALWLLSKSIRNNFKNYIKNINFLHVNLSNDIFYPYKKEIFLIEKNIIDQGYIENSEEWKSTINSFEKIIKIANSINAKLIFLIFPHRDIIYYEKATGKKLPINYQYLIEKKLLKSFLDIKEVTLVDPKDKLIEYVNRLEKNFDIKSLPYLEIDGHMNDIGHKIIADLILTELSD